MRPMMKPEPPPKESTPAVGIPVGVSRPDEKTATGKKNSGPVGRLIVFAAKEVGIRILGFLGILAGLALSPLIFLVSLIKGARAVHTQGVLCKAEIVPFDLPEPDRSVGARFAGPALVRFSGANKPEDTRQKDVLGLALRMRMPREEDGTPEVGDQDIALGTFESFRSLIFGNDMARVNSADYLANDYDSVAPWRIEGLGVVRLRALGMAPRDPARGRNRHERLEADIAAGCELLLGYHPNDGKRGPVKPIAILKLTSVSPLPPQQLRISLFRTARKAKAVGFRNGIRAIAYPVGQLARRIRGG